MKKILFYLFLILDNSFSVLSQNKTVYDFIEPIKTFSVDNYGTYEDNNGEIWVFSEDGLELFDFKGSKKVKNYGGQISNDIWRMFKDNKDRLWLLHRGNKASYIKNGIIHSIPYPKDVQNLLPDCAYGDTIFFKNRYSKTASYQLLPNDTFEEIKSHNRQKTLFRVMDGDLHVFEEDGATYYTTLNTPKTRMKYSLEQIQVAPEEEQLYYNKAVYLNRETKSDTIIFYRNEKFEAKKMSDFFGVNVLNIRAISDEKGTIIETPTGIRFYEDLYTKKRDLRVEKIINYFYKKFGFNFFVTIDSNNNLWITIKRGVVYFIPSFWGNIESTEISKFVVDIKNLEKDQVIVKTSDGFLYHYNLKSNQSKLFETTPKTQRILNYFVDNKTLHWFNYNTLFKYDFNQISTIDFQPKYAKINSEYIGNNQILFFNGDLYNTKNKQLSRLNAWFFKESITKIIPLEHFLIICLNSK